MNIITAIQIIGMLKLEVIRSLRFNDKERLPNIVIEKCSKRIIYNVNVGGSKFSSKRKVKKSTLKQGFVVRINADVC